MTSASSATNDAKGEEDHPLYQRIHDLLYGAHGTKQDNARAGQLLEEKMSGADAEMQDPILHALQADQQRLVHKNDPALWDKAYDLGLLERATVQKNPHAMYYMGVLYYMGEANGGCHGVPQDHFMAYDWFHQAAAAAGHASAMFSIGCLYHVKVPTPTPYAVQKAQEWYTQAAALGHATACNNLALLYQRNASVLLSDEDKKLQDKDATKAACAVAKSWYDKAAAQGNATALYNLGVMYETKLRNKEMARWYYTQAAEKGHVPAERLPRQGWWWSFVGSWNNSKKDEETKLFLV